MKAMTIEAFGDAADLKMIDLPTPTPHEHEVLIKVEYAAVNPVDWKICKGYLQSAFPHQFPLIPGWDASGTISAVGKNVRTFKVGDPVYAYCRKPVVHEGTYAEFVAFDAMHVAKKPSNISFGEAAAIPLAALTAWQALFDFAHLKKGQSILIHAGAGGVGSFAIEFAKHAGAEVFTTCSEKNNPYVKKLGADHVIDYNKENFVNALKKIKKEGVDIVFDTVGGSTLEQSYAAVKPGGTLVTIVQRLGPEAGEKLNIRTGFVFVRPDGIQLKEIAKLIEQGIVKIPEVKELTLKDAKQALKLSEAGHTRGKIVLKVT